MSNLDIRKVKETFARLFVMAVQNEVNFMAFTKALERSVFANLIEANRYDDYFNSPLEDIFFDITRRRIDKDESLGYTMTLIGAAILISNFKEDSKSLSPFCS